MCFWKSGEILHLILVECHQPVVSVIVFQNLIINLKSAEGSSSILDFGEPLWPRLRQTFKISTKLRE
jgi:hypothetical protein